VNFFTEERERERERDFKYLLKSLSRYQKERGRCKV